jgi:hypothetical protein
MKMGKAAGIDDVPAEFLKMIGETLKKLVDLCMEVYNTGIWPEDFTKSVLIPIPKKANAVECYDRRRDTKEARGLMYGSIQYRYLARRFY